MKENIRVSFTLLTYNNDLHQRGNQCPNSARPRILARTTAEKNNAIFLYVCMYVRTYWQAKLAVTAHSTRTRSAIGIFFLISQRYLGSGENGDAIEHIKRPQ